MPLWNYYAVDTSTKVSQMIIILPVLNIADYMNDSTFTCKQFPQTKNDLGRDDTFTWSRALLTTQVKPSASFVHLHLVCKTDDVTVLPMVAILVYVTP